MAMAGLPWEAGRGGWLWETLAAFSTRTSPCQIALARGVLIPCVTGKNAIKKNKTNYSYLFSLGKWTN